MTPAEALAARLRKLDSAMYCGDYGPSFLERAIVAEARQVLNNPKLRVKDIMEWATHELEPHDGEIVIYVSDPGVYVAFKREDDKRRKR